MFTIGMFYEIKPITILEKVFLSDKLIFIIITFYWEFESLTNYAQNDFKFIIGLNCISSLENQHKLYDLTKLL